MNDITHMTIDDLASPEYRALLQKRYEQPGWGGSGKSWANHVRSFYHDIGAQTVLDYGCGRGTLKQALEGIDVREYDPGIIGKDKVPLRPVDLVVCTDVLEHIEPDKIGAVLVHIRSLALKGVFLNIALDAAKEKLPDGRNAHLLQMKPDWWEDQLAKAALWPSQTQHRAGKQFIVWVRL